MIDSVRNTVMAVLNKNNYGPISPDDFNFLAKQAQLDIFKEYFHNYNKQLQKENAMVSGSGDADVKRIYELTIERFKTSALLTYDAGNGNFYLPSIATTGDEYYRIDRIDCYDPNAPANFLAEADKVQSSKENAIVNSLIMAPTSTFPIYVLEGSRLKIYPSSYRASSLVKCHYVRYPLDPKWTYSTLTNGEPIFNQSLGDYQDFELLPHCEPELVDKILKYAGLSIRDELVVSMLSKEEDRDIVTKHNG